MSGEESPPPEEIPEEVHVPVSTDSEQGDTPQDIGEAAVDQAVGESSESEAAEPSSRIIIEDKDKAHDMAIAGDPKRISAAHARRSAHYFETGVDTHGKWKGSGNFGADFRPSVRREWAQSQDEEAARIEEWAGILHDHPVSDSYKEAHPEVSFTPRGLNEASELQGHRTREANEARREADMLSEAESLSPEVLMTYLNKVRYSSLTSPMTRDQIHAFDDLFRKPDTTTLEDIKSFMGNAYKEHAAKLEAKVSAVGAVLDDVESGKTAEEQTS